MVAILSRYPESINARVIDHLIDFYCRVLQEFPNEFVVATSSCQVHWVVAGVLGQADFEAQIQLLHASYISQGLYIPILDRIMRLPLQLIERLIEFLFEWLFLAASAFADHYLPQVVRSPALHGFEVETVHLIHLDIDLWFFFLSLLAVLLLAGRRFQGLEVLADEVAVHFDGVCGRVT